MTPEELSLYVVTGAGAGAGAGAGGRGDCEWPAAEPSVEEWVQAGASSPRQPAGCHCQGSGFRV